MKICADCGRKLEKGVATCGCMVDTENKIVPNPVLEIVERAINTRLFLFALITFTVAVVLNLIGTFFPVELTGSLDVLELAGDGSLSLMSINNIISKAGINTGYLWVTGALTAFDSLELCAFTCTVPSLVLVIGIWVIYHSVKSSVNFKVNNIGFKIVGTMLIIFASIIALNLMDILGGIQYYIFFAIIEASFDGFIAFAFAIIIGGLCFVALSLFYAKAGENVYSVGSSIEKRVIRTFSPALEIATMAFGGISAVFTFVSIFTETEYSVCFIVFNVITKFTSSFATILFGLLLRSLREQINSFVENKIRTV